jgi:hypothetical protein
MAMNEKGIVDMTLREQLLAQALALPSADQAFLAQSLEDHLIAHAPQETAEADGVSGSELLTELHRRSAAYRSGQSSSRLASDVLTDLRRRQGEKRANLPSASWTKPKGKSNRLANISTDRPLPSVIDS